MRKRLTADRVPDAVIDVLRTLMGAGHEAWLVGGGVRDLLRSDHPRPAKDWDLATSALPKAVQRLFPKVIPTGVQHGTVTVLTLSGPVEVTTFRGETGYSDARRPDKVEFLMRVDEDLARRDFTINAIAWNPLDGRLEDPFGGIEDLGRRVVRAVRDPIERFTEDGLRPMRAIRFACVLEFDLDPATKAAIPKTIPSFRKVAIERVRQELERIMSAKMASVGLDLMAETGLLAEFLPELARESEERWRPRLRSIDSAPRDGPVRYAILLDGAGLGGASRAEAGLVMERLRFPKVLSASVDRLVSVSDWGVLLNAGPPDLRRVLASVGRERVADVAAFWRALSLGEGEKERWAQADELARSLEDEARGSPPLGPSDLALSGAEVMEALGMGPGPKIGRAISYLVDLVIEDPGRNERAALLAALEDWKRE